MCCQCFATARPPKPRESLGAMEAPGIEEDIFRSAAMSLDVVEMRWEWGGDARARGGETCCLFEMLVVHSCLTPCTGLSAGFSFALSRMSPHLYSYVVSLPLGRTSYKEQYLFIYR